VWWYGFGLATELKGEVDLAGEEDAMRTSWVEICVSDLSESIEWFAKVLDFKPVDRDTHYAGLRRGETTILLGTDDGPYWSPEKDRIPPAGSRGGGVEIVLMVDGVDSLYERARSAAATIVRPLQDQPWGMRQFWVRHPDGYLIRPAQRMRR
jgi:uncharacterized glyoxalase superfamily protein PhnB